MAEDLIEAAQPFPEPRVAVREQLAPQTQHGAFLLQLPARPPAEIAVRPALRLLVTSESVGKRAIAVQELPELKKPCTATVRVW